MKNERDVGRMGEQDHGSVNLICSIATIQHGWDRIELIPVRTAIENKGRRGDTKKHRM
jgi:hypothetical protein